MTPANRLFCFGLGFTGLALARSLQRRGWHVAGTCRSAETAARLGDEGIAAFVFDGVAGAAGTDSALAESLDAATHLLATAPPGTSGDPVLIHYRDEIAALAPPLRWVGYLSTTGVYGDRDGALVDETAALRPTSPRGERRVAAERAWRDLQRDHGLPLHIFRLAGIFGPGRNALVAVRAGTARRIVKPGQLFSRIHLADILLGLEASMAQPDPGAVYNLCDDEAAPPQDVIAYASQLLGLPPPPEIPFDEAQLSPMARSFYSENKRVDNRRMKDDLGIVLRYPNYRAGLQALFDAGEGTVS